MALDNFSPCFNLTLLKLDNFQFCVNGKSFGEKRKTFSSYLLELSAEEN
jgi:hypothetical protein